MKDDRLPNALAAACGADLSKIDRDVLMGAETEPTRDNVEFLRVVWGRPMFELQSRPVIVDVRRLLLPGKSAAA